MSLRLRNILFTEFWMIDISFATDKTVRALANLQPVANKKFLLHNENSEILICINFLHFNHKSNRQSRSKANVERNSQQQRANLKIHRAWDNEVRRTTSSIFNKRIQNMNKKALNIHWKLKFQIVDKLCEKHLQKSKRRVEEPYLWMELDPEPGAKSFTANDFQVITMICEFQHTLTDTTDSNDQSSRNVLSGRIINLANPCCLQRRHCAALFRPEQRRSWTAPHFWRASGTENSLSIYVHLGQI